MLQALRNSRNTPDAELGLSGLLNAHETNTKQQWVFRTMVVAFKNKSLCYMSCAPSVECLLHSLLGKLRLLLSRCRRYVWHLQAIQQRPGTKSDRLLASNSLKCPDRNWHVHLLEFNRLQHLRKKVKWNCKHYLRCLFLWNSLQQGYKRNSAMLSDYLDK